LTTTFVHSNKTEHYLPASFRSFVAGMTSILNNKAIEKTQMLSERRLLDLV